ncbi:MAG: DUF2807 domain-containing protein [Alistipes sp.]
MKKVIIILVILAAIVGITGSLVCCANGVLTQIQRERLKGSGNLVTRDISLATFDCVEASRGVKVVLIAGSASQQASLEADDNVIDLVVARVEQGKLKVSLDSKLQSFSNIHVTLVVPTEGKISQIGTSSGAQVESAVTLTGDVLKLDASSGSMIEVTAHVTQCEVDASSGAEIVAQMSATTCDVDASSGAEIQLSGSAHDGTMEGSSGAEINAKQLTMSNCTATASSGAEVAVQCSAQLDASASSAASICYNGDCKVTARKSSGGEIRKK